MPAQIRAIAGWWNVATHWIIEKRGEGRVMGLIEKCEKIFEGKSVAYDFALPQEWANDVREKTGIYPPGEIVWLYDEEARCFGRPYSVTLLGWIALTTYTDVLEREKRGSLI